MNISIDDKLNNVLYVLHGTNKRSNEIIEIKFREREKNKALEKYRYYKNNISYKNTKLNKYVKIDGNMILCTSDVF